MRCDPTHPSSSLLSSSLSSSSIKTVHHTSTMETPYQADPRLCLVLTAEFDISDQPQLHLLDQAAHDDAAEVVVESIGLFKPGDLKVERVESDEELDFDTAHSMPTPESWFMHPVVVQFMYTPDKTRVFGRVTVSLLHYDGVSGFHTIFNIMEYLEHKDDDASPEAYLSKPFFKTANALVVFDPAKMDAHVEMLQKTAETSKNDGTKLPVGPPRARLEDSLQPRVWTRFSNSQTNFKDFVRISTECQQRLELPYIAYTVNYAPEVCLGRLPTISDTLNHQKRADGIFTPNGPPMPMNIDHAEAVSYMIFWNNYGVHNPNITSKVTAAAWNWTGLPKCFTPLMWAATIQGKSFFVTSISSGDASAVEDLVSSIDGGLHLKECPQPSAPAVLVAA
jgi:hypothetical protein